MTHIIRQQIALVNHPLCALRRANANTGAVTQHSGGNRLLDRLESIEIGNVVAKESRGREFVATDIRAR